MKNLLFKLKVLTELIVAVTLIYAAIVYSFSSVIINILIMIVSLFFFIQALSNIDIINGYNQSQQNQLGKTDNTDSPNKHHNRNINHYESTNHKFPDSNYDYDDYQNDYDDDSYNTQNLNENDYPDIPE